ncbi:unnamed protein product [Adineta steineri]|uniref:G domain-containing protein n=1 Tax=Adineta steineri TaxID=433720 RepID=A0A815JKV6_9BILA|nr:unnamed protein product [Adineta steineri]
MYRCNCSKQFYNQIDLDDHKKNCQGRFFICELCNENIPSYNMTYHLNQCGNKTIKCSKCQNYIRRAIYNYHLDNNCTDLDEDENIFTEKDIEYKHVRNSNSVEEEQNSEEQLFTNNNTQMDDNIFIPCQFCNEQIEISLYYIHSFDCSQDQSHRELNYAHPLNNSNTYEKSNEKHSDKILINSTSGKSLSKENSLSLLHKKTAVVQDELCKDYYLPEVNHVTDKVQFNIILTGSPRVGKSQLINALSNGEIKAKTSPSLNSCTTEVQCYTLEDNQQRTPGIKPFRINFYDTPGIESWTNEQGQSTMLKFIAEKDPVCLIFCASPGAFADLKQLRPVLEYCQTKQIFCALVCTNMWASPARKQVIEEFKQELLRFGEPMEKLFQQEHTRIPHKVTLFGNGALCTMVNSTEYDDPDLSSEIKPVQGVDELIHCIMNELDHEKLLGWCNAVLYRRSFWEKMSQKVGGFFSLHTPNLNPTGFISGQEIAMNMILHLFNKFKK